MSTPDLRGRRVLITGANAGIGRSTALALGAMGAELILAGRSAERHAEVLGALSARGVKATFEPLDLADLPTVAALSARLRAGLDRLDVLVNNAGLAGQRGATKQGFELAFGTNHLGPFALTAGLLPLLEKSAEPRVVNVASRAHARTKTIDLAAVQQPTRTATGFPEYGVSKLANVLHARGLVRRYPWLFAASLHPGVIASDIWREVPGPARFLIKLFMKDNDAGAATSIMLASQPLSTLERGGYYSETVLTRPNRAARDDALEAELWARSEAWAREHGGIAAQNAG